MLKSSPFFLAFAALLAGCGGVRSSLPPAVGSQTAAQALSQRHRGSQEQILYTFKGSTDGGDPAADLVFGSSGKLYGTTVVGGAASCGTVFTLTPHAGPPWPESVLYSFTCYSDGKNPYGGVTFDSRGDAYDGVTVSGGAGPSCGSSGCGVAFELQAMHESILHAFTGGSDGFGPGNGLAIDAHGNLFGTTPDGGQYSAGTVYELFKRAGRWHEKVIHAFTGGSDGGGGMLGRLTIDSAGNVYGVTEVGGAYGAGTVYELTPKSRNRFEFTTLHEFKGTPDCASPYGGVYVAPSGGSVYGTTYAGGANGLGCMFVLVKLLKYAGQTLYSFKGGNDGSMPTGTLTLSRHHLLGTTSMGGGTCDCGTVFSLDERTQKEATLHAFGGDSDGAYPYYGVTMDSARNLYGTTAAGGAPNQGTVFEVLAP